MLPGVGHVPNETEGGAEASGRRRTGVASPVRNVSQSASNLQIEGFLKHMKQVLCEKELFTTWPVHLSLPPALPGLQVCSAYPSGLRPPPSHLTSRPNSNGLFSMKLSLIPASQNEQCSIPCAHLHILHCVLEHVSQELCYTCWPLQGPKVPDMPHPACIPVSFRTDRQCDITFVTCVGLTGSCGRKLVGLLRFWFKGWLGTGIFTEFLQ